MVDISPILPEQVEEVRTLIYTVAHDLLQTGRTLEGDLAIFRARWAMPDLEDVQASYLRDGGAFLVAVENGRVIGSGGIQRVSVELCELKRFWFYPEYHGTGLSHQLFARLLETARAMGCRKMRLVTTQGIQDRAIAFYRKHGFIEIENYGRDPGDISMERTL